MSAEQGELLPASPKPVENAVAAETEIALASPGPVASVLVMGLLGHLDRSFDYAVPAEMSDAGPGTRVRVKFAGRARDGFVLERKESTDSSRRLAALTALVSPLSVLTPEVLAEARRIAVRCGGSVADVVRLAVPPRHARAERSVLSQPMPARGAGDADDAGPVPGGDRAEPDRPVSDDGADASPGASSDAETSRAVPAHALDAYAGGAALRRHLAAADGSHPRAAIALRPADAPAAIVWDAIAALPPDAGALVLAPDQRDVDALIAACPENLADQVRVLSSHAGPEKRYRDFTTVLTGRARIAVGNRSAAFAPVRDLSLICVIDDGDDLYAEPRAPYAHARLVATVRAHHEGAALLMPAHARSVEAEQLVESGWAVDMRPLPADRGAVSPRIVAMDEYLREREGPAGYSRIPGLALRTVRDGLERGPVLVQVPRSGYVPALACAHCGTLARCPQCSAQLGQRSRAPEAACAVCGHSLEDYECPDCHRRSLRAVSVGSTRTAEELRRAFPDTELVRSGGAEGAVSVVGSAPRIVVATPGAEPRAEGGYAAALLLDGTSLLARAAYDADVEALRRWSNAAALVRPAEDGGEVLAVVDAALPPVQGLIRWDSPGYAARVLAERAELALPPVTRCVQLTGDDAAVRDVLVRARNAGAPPLDAYGPRPVARSRREIAVEGGAAEDAGASSAVVKLEPSRAREELAALRGAVTGRAARKLPGSVTLRVDPPDVF